MTYNESIALIAAVAFTAFWLGRKQANKPTSTAAADPYSLDWLGAWAKA